MIPILQMSKLRLKKVKKLAQDQRASKFYRAIIWREIWPIPELTAFTTLPYLPPENVSSAVVKRKLNMETKQMCSLTLILTPEEGPRRDKVPSNKV